MLHGIRIPDDRNRVDNVLVDNTRLSHVSLSYCAIIKDVDKGLFFSIFFSISFSISFSIFFFQFLFQRATRPSQREPLGTVAGRGWQWHQVPPHTVVLTRLWSSAIACRFLWPQLPPPLCTGSTPRLSHAYLCGCTETIWHMMRQYPATAFSSTPNL